MWGTSQPGVAIAFGAFMLSPKPASMLKAFSPLGHAVRASVLRLDAGVFLLTAAC